MEIFKDGKTYTVTMTTRYWKVSKASGKIAVEYKLPRKDYPTIEDVEELVLTDNMF